jgi:hypothetical protein
VLGLGNIGPRAAKPVMEGKGVLFKRFADIDVFDLEIDETDRAWSTQGGERAAARCKRRFDRAHDGNHGGSGEPLECVTKVPRLSEGQPNKL